MTNRSFSDLSINQRREWIAALLAVGLQRVVDKTARISDNSDDLRLAVSSDLNLSMSQFDKREPDGGDANCSMSPGTGKYAEKTRTSGGA